MMKLSEAIILGSTQVKSTRGLLLSRNLLTDQLSGCAFGMALVAIYTPEERRCRVALYDIWPWLHIIVPLPCECGGYRLDARHIIMHLFDTHVAPQRHTHYAGPAPWTLDRLVDWVRERENELEAPTEAPEHELETVGAFAK